MTEQQQFEIALKMLQRIATAVEQQNAILARMVKAMSDLDASFNEVIIQGTSGRAYVSAVLRKSPE